VTLKIAPQSCSFNKNLMTGRWNQRLFPNLGRRRNNIVTLARPVNISCLNRRSLFNRHVYKKLTVCQSLAPHFPYLERLLEVSS